MAAPEPARRAELEDAGGQGGRAGAREHVPLHLVEDGAPHVLVVEASPCGNDDDAIARRGERRQPRPHLDDEGGTRAPDGVAHPRGERLRFGAVARPQWARGRRAGARDPRARQRVRRFVLLVGARAEAPPRQRAELGLSRCRREAGFEGHFGRAGRVDAGEGFSFTNPNRLQPEGDGVELARELDLLRGRVRPAGPSFAPASNAAMTRARSASPLRGATAPSSRMTDAARERARSAPAQNVGSETVTVPLYACAARAVYTREEGFGTRGTTRGAASRTNMKKNYVLDTNVLLHDPHAIFKFEDNDIILPIYVIEEIDQFKREARTAGATRAPSRACSTSCATAAARSPRGSRSRAAARCASRSPRSCRSSRARSTRRRWTGHPADGDRRARAGRRVSHGLRDDGHEPAHPRRRARDGHARRTRTSASTSSSSTAA